MELEREGAAAFVQTEGNAERGRREEHRGNDFLPPFLPFSLPVASERENVISIRHTCHEKVERERGKGRERGEGERSGDIVEGGREGRAVEGRGLQ